MTWELLKAVGFMALGAFVYKRYLEGKLGGDIATACKAGTRLGGDIWQQGAAGWK